MVLGFLVFWKCTQGDLLAWDDEQSLIENTILQNGPLSQFWTQPFFGMFIPVTYSLWSLIFQFFGLSSEVFHSLNIGLHLCNGLMVYFLFVRLSKHQFLAFLGALIFVVHPLQVDAVAWASGTRDLLSTSFALLATLTFTGQNLKHKKYFAPLFYGTGLLCKPSIIMLPFTLAVLHWPKDRASIKQLLFALLPWLALALPIAWITRGTQNPFVTIDLTWWQRAFVMMDAFGFYPMKFFYPTGLAVDYGRTPNWFLQNFSSQPIPILSLIGLLGLSVWTRTADFWRKPVIAMILMLIPVSGLVTFGFQYISTVANHYFYFPMFFLILAGVNQASAISRKYETPFFAATFAVGILFGFLSSERIDIWHDNKTFFAQMLEDHPNSFPAHTQLGRLEQKAGNLPKAAEHIFAANRINPQVFAGIANKYILLQTIEAYDAVVPLDRDVDGPIYDSARRLEPKAYANMLNSLAVSLAKKEMWQRALVRICQTLAYDPSHPQALRNLQIIRGELLKKNLPEECP